MKKCTLCHIEKPLEMFYKSKGDIRSRCKECWQVGRKPGNKDNIRKTRVSVKTRNKQHVSLYLKDHPCVDCGEDNIVVLEFDHVRGGKKSNVGQLVCGYYSIDTIKQEIDKCDVRCANCHRIKTAKEHYYDWGAVE